MSFYENGWTWPFYLFIYIPLSASSCPWQMALWKVPDIVGWVGWTYPSQIQKKTKKKQHTHTLPKTLFPININNSLSLPVFHRSFSLVIHKSAKCPFQAAHKHPHRSPKMPPHSEARAVDGSEAHSSSAHYSQEVMNVRMNAHVHYSLLGKVDGSWVEVSKCSSKVLIKRGKCKCYSLVWSKKHIKLILEKHYSTLLLQSTLVSDFNLHSTGVRCQGNFRNNLCTILWYIEVTNIKWFNVPNNMK